MPKVSGALLGPMYEFIFEIFGCLLVVFSLFSVRKIPLSVCVGLVFAIYFSLSKFYFSALGSTSDLSLVSVIENPNLYSLGLFSNISAYMIIISIIKGAVVGVFVSSCMFVVLLSCNWVSKIAFSGFSCCSQSDLSYALCGYDEASLKELLNTIFVLIFLTVLFSVVGFSNVVYFIGRAFITFSQFSAVSSDAGSLGEVGIQAVRLIGSFAFYSALIFALPVFVSVMALDVIAMVGNRYIKGLSLSDSLRIPLVLLVLTFTLYTMTLQLEILASKTIGELGLECLSRLIEQETNQ